MAKDQRRLSTVERHNIVHILYAKIKAELGITYKYVSKSYYYDRIASETNLSIRQIAYILNHTQYTDTAQFEK